MDNNYSHEAAENENAVVKKPKSTLGIISLIMGILSVIPCCCNTGFVFGIVAIILSCVEKKKLGECSKLGKAGLILGIIGLILGIGVAVFCIFSGALSGVMNGMLSIAQ